MKKILIMILILSTFLITSCNKKTEYYTVYGGGMYMSDSNFFSESEVGNFTDLTNYVDPYIDNTAESERSEMIFGKEIELFYNHTFKKINSDWLCDYESKDGKQIVQYDKKSNEISYLMDTSLCTAKTSELTEEEIIDIGYSFAEEKWDFITRDTSYFNINIFQGEGFDFCIMPFYENFVTFNSVSVNITNEGVIYGWSEQLLTKPLVDSLLNELQSLDYTKFTASIEHFVNKDSVIMSKKNCEIIEYEKPFLMFNNDGSPYYNINTNIKIDGREKEISFNIRIEINTSNKNKS